MIDNIDKLKKVSDILNSEGPILGLYKFGEQLYLVSFLSDGTGTIYYSTTKNKLFKYFNDDIVLQELYIESEDFIVHHKFQGNTTTYLKQDFKDKIQCGDKYYSELPDRMKNPNIKDKIT